MQTLKRINDEHTEFIITNVPIKYHEAFRNLAYTQTKRGFMKSYPNDTPHLDAAYSHFEQNILTIIKQAAKEIPVPFEEGFKAFLERTYHLEADWWLGGSAALALRGLPIQPGDIDLIVDSAGARRWGDALADVMIEPVASTGGWFCELWGRAFLHARIEWTGGIDPKNDFTYVTEFYLPSVDKLETISWHGFQVRIPPLEPQLTMEKMRGRTERAALIQAALDAQE
jgi:hypothetical protein